MTCRYESCNAVTFLDWMSRDGLGPAAAFHLDASREREVHLRALMAPWSTALASSFSSSNKAGTHESCGTIGYILAQAKTTQYLLSRGTTEHPRSTSSRLNGMKVHIMQVGWARPSCRVRSSRLLRTTTHTRTLLSIHLISMVSPLWVILQQWLIRLQI
jgi:hypothetical protein